VHLKIELGYLLYYYSDLTLYLIDIIIRLNFTIAMDTQGSKGPSFRIFRGISKGDWTLLCIPSGLELDEDGFASDVFDSGEENPSLQKLIKDPSRKCMLETIAGRIHMDKLRRAQQGEFWSDEDQQLS
jgi:hypothetical protein